MCRSDLQRSKGERHGPAALRFYEVHNATIEGIDMAPLIDAGLAKMRRITQVAVGLARGGLLKEPVPLFASLVLTARCNQDCPYCGCSLQADAPELTCDEWLAVIDDLVASGAVTFSFTGGEPLLRPDLPILARACADRGLGVNLQTNGLLLPRYDGDLDHFSTITLSLDSVASVNDTIRGSGAYDATLKALRFARAKGKAVRLTTVLSRQSLRHLPEFLRLIRGLRTPVMFQPMRPTYLNAASSNLEPPDRAQVRRAVRLLMLHKAAGAPILNSFASLYYMTKWPGPGRINCAGARFFVRVTSSGRMEICGLETDPSPGDVDVRDGVLNGLRKIASIENRCSACWTMARAEINLALSFSPSAMVNVLRRM